MKSGQLVGVDRKPYRAVGNLKYFRHNYGRLCVPRAMCC